MKQRAMITIAMSALLFAGAYFSPLSAEAKKWTVTQRVEKLSKEIDEGRSANELTTKQVDSLKKMVDEIKTRMEKMKNKNGGKLSVPDTKSLHDDMTNLSVKIYKQRMDNVYSD